jgi:hypothetical protein
MHRRELRRQALQFAREKEVLAAKLQDLVSRQSASAAAAGSPNRRRSTLLTQQRVALEATEMQQWREQQDFESKHALDAARIAQLEEALCEAKAKADKGREREVELMGQIAELKEKVAERDERLLAAASAPPPLSLPAAVTPSRAPVASASAAALCLSPQHTSTSSTLASRVLSPSVARHPSSPAPCASRSEAALASAEAQVVQLQQALQRRQQEVESLHAQLVLAQDALAAPEEAAAAAQLMVDALQLRLQECQAQKDAAAAAASAALALAEQQQQHADAKIMQLQATVSEFQVEAASAAAAIAELQEACSCAQQSTEFHSDRAQQLQLELAEARDHVQAATEQHQLLTQQVILIQLRAMHHPSHVTDHLTETISRCH